MSSTCYVQPEEEWLLAILLPLPFDERRSDSLFVPFPGMEKFIDRLGKETVLSTADTSSGYS